LIYGGDEIQVRSGVRVCPVTEIEVLHDSVATETAEPGRS
jgi:hypothetical protein